jgi:acyl-CoA synthetase (AMP-forming)/AMP-acid ligase II
MLTKVLSSSCTPDVVAVSLNHGAAFISAVAATWTADNVLAPVSTKATSSELSTLLKMLRPARIVCEVGDERFARLQPPPIELLSTAELRVLAFSADPHTALSPGDALLATTSGTTGVPKGVVVGAAAILANCMAVANALMLSVDDRILVFTPTHFTYSLVQVLASLIADATILSWHHGLLSPTDLAHFAIAHRATGVSANPTAFELWIRSFANPHRMRYVLSAGQPLTWRLFETIKTCFPGAVVMSGYGCTENTNRITIASLTGPTHFRRGVATVGWPIPGTDVHLDVSGHVVLTGNSLLRGYLDDLEAGKSRVETFDTGDIGETGDNGELFLVGRVSTRMNVGNEMVDPEEVETAIGSANFVAECAVGAIPDDVLGDAIGAVVVLKEGVVAEEARRQLRTVLLPILRQSRWPHHLAFVSPGAIPRTSYGKIDRRKLRASLADRFRTPTTR